MYKSNVLLYDRQTESLWSQILNEAVTGPLTGTTLKTFPSTMTTWKKWKKKHPDTVVLSTDTGHKRNYFNDPYSSYYKSPLPFLTQRKKYPGLKPKELVLAVNTTAGQKAYPLEKIKTSKGPLHDKLGPLKIRIDFDMDTDQFKVTDGNNNNVEHIITYWFIWYSFYPETELYPANRRR